MFEVSLKHFQPKPLSGSPCWEHRYAIDHVADWEQMRPSNCLPFDLSPSFAELHIFHSSRLREKINFHRWKDFELKPKFPEARGRKTETQLFHKLHLRANFLWGKVLLYLWLSVSYCTKLNRNVFEGNESNDTSTIENYTM